jgi:phage-related protein
MEWQIQYYNETVRLEINSWPVGIRAVYARITERMKIHGPNLGMPFTRALDQGLFEIRAKAKEGIGRAFFCTVVDGRIIILHSFIKKTQKTPLKELQKARNRLKDIRNDNT